MQTETRLIIDGDPVYQPALDHGIRYNEPTSRSTATYWYRGEDHDNRLSREQVAEILGVSLREVIAWENATDLACEEECRADDDLGW